MKCWVIAPPPPPEFLKKKTKKNIAKLLTIVSPSLVSLVLGLKFSPYTVWLYGLNRF
jgi:hypothetical protein